MVSTTIVNSGWSDGAGWPEKTNEDIVALAVAEKQKLLREGRRRYPVDTNVFWFDTVFRSESVTTLLVECSR